mgnify:CR=1 FL=1
MRRLGATNLLVVQALILIASLFPNGIAWFYEVRLVTGDVFNRLGVDDVRSSPSYCRVNQDFEEETQGHNENKVGQERRRAGGYVTLAQQVKEGATDNAAKIPLWRSPLIVAIALNTFGIIFCKTVVEYQYNVLVSDSLSVEGMVSYR